VALARPEKGLSRTAGSGRRIPDALPPGGQRPGRRGGHRGPHVPMLSWWASWSPRQTRGRGHSRLGVRRQRPHPDLLCQRDRAAV